MLRGLASVVLILLQWALVLLGLLLIVMALQTFAIETRWFAAQPIAVPGQDSFAPPTFQRLVTSGLTGLIAVGLGATLYYLRCIFLRRDAARAAQRGA